MMRAFFLLGSTLLLTSHISAKSLIILEKGSGKPLVHAEVKVGPTTCYTDKTGGCTLSDSKAVTCTIRQAGYTTETIRISSEETQSIYLTPILDADETVTVKGAPRIEVSQKRISIQEIQKIVPNADPAQVPKYLPGVQVFGFDSRWVVRGSGPADSLYYMDQVYLPLIFHPIGGFAGGLSILPDNAVEDVTFSNGGFGPQYGDATGGVLTINTKSEIPDRSISEVRVNVPFFGSLYHAQPIGEDQFVAASYRKSFLEYIIPPVLKKANKGKEDLTVVPYFGDGNLEYVKKTDDGHYKVFFLYAYDGIKAAFPSAESLDETGKSNIDFLTVETDLSVNRKKSLNGHWSMNTTPNWLQYRQNVDFLGNNIDINSANINVPFELTYRKDRAFKLFTGVDGTWSRTVLNLLVPRPPTTNDPFYDIETTPKLERAATVVSHKEAVWVGVEWRLGDWVLAPGARGFHAEANGRSGVDPRFNLRWELSPKVAIKGAVGQYSELPQPDQTDEVFGNSRLRYMQCMHYVLGVETKWNEQWETDIQVFYKRFLHMVEADAVTGYNNDGSGVSRGFEVFLRRNLTTRLFGWIAYTWSLNRVRDNAAGDLYPSPYDQTHIFHLVGDYRVSTNWSFGGRYLFQSGNTYTPVTGSVYDTNLDKYTPRYASTDKNAARLPLTRNMSVFANRDILYDRWTFKLRFGVENFALGKNVTNISHNYDYSQTEPVQSIPFIPYVELRAIL